MNNTQTPNLVTPPEPSKEKALSYPSEQNETSDAWKAFFSLTGGSILYCLSAMSIIFGISNILGPNLAQANIMKEALPSLLALNIYEIALLGVLTVIVVWQNVLDDAISLVVLVALFLIGSGLTLSSVANNGHQAALWIGLGAFGLGAIKLQALRKMIGLKISVLSFYGLLLLLAWNFLTGALNVKNIVAGGDDASRLHWLISWLVFLAGGFIVLLEAVSKTEAHFESNERRGPFLRIPAMFWIFVTILLAAGGVHQYVLGYIFDVKSSLGDYIPLVSLVSLLLLQLSLTLSARIGSKDVFIALVPLGTCLFALIGKSTVAKASLGPELLWYPPVLIGLTGILVLWMGLKFRSLSVQAASAGYLLGIILTWGFSPERPFDLHWHLTGALCVAGMFITGLIKKNAPLCVIAVIIATIGIVSTSAFNKFIALYSIAEPAGYFGVAGLGLIGTALIFGRNAQQILAAAGTILFAIFLLDHVQTRPALADLLMLATVIVLGGALWLRTGKWMPSAILCLSMVHKLWVLFMRLTAWRYVILSFILLFAGAWLSIQKGKRMKRETRENLDTTPSSSPPGM